MKFDVIVADCPWKFSDGLKMDSVKRGAGSQYDELNIKAIKELPVGKVAADDCVIALWVPGSFLQEGLDVMKAWGFDQKQVHVWVKTKKKPLDLARKNIPMPKISDIKKNPISLFKELKSYISSSLLDFKLDNILAFGMGRLFRQTHEIALVGTRGKVYGNLKDKSQRSVHFGPAMKHSAKPEDLQNMLDKMFPNANKLELFARRSRTGWKCLGNQCPDSYGEDIRDSLKKLIPKEDLEDHNLSICELYDLHHRFGLTLKESKKFTKKEVKYILRVLR